MRKTIGTVAVVVLVLVVGGVLAVRAFFPPEKVRRMVTERAGEALGVEVSLDDARVSLFPLGIEVRGLRIQNQAPDAPPFLDLREAKVSMRLLPLLSRRIEIAHVEARGMAAALVIEKKPEALEQPAEAAPPPEPGTDVVSSFTLLLSSAEIEEGTVLVINRVTGSDFLFDSVSARTALRVGARGGAVVAEGTVRARRVHAPQLAAIGHAGGLGPVGADYEIDYDPAAGSARVRSLEVSVRQLSLGIKGEATGLPDAPRGTFAIATPEIRLEELLSLLPAERAGDFEGSGPLSVEGEVRFAPDEPPSYRLVLALGGLDVRNKRYKGKIERLAGRIELSEEKAVIENLTATVEGKPFTVNGTITQFADPVLDLSVRGELDLEALAEAGLLPEKLRAAGRLKLDIRANGPAKRPGDLSLGGAVDVENLSVATEDPPILVEEGSGRLALSGTTAEASGFRFRFNGSPTTLEGSVRNPLGEPAVSFDLRTRKIDLNAFLPPPEGGEKASKPSEVPIVLPPLPPIDAKGRIRVDTLLTGVNVLSGVDARIDIEKGAGTIRLDLAEGVFGGVRVRKAGSDLRVRDGVLTGTLAAESALAYRILLTSLKGKIAVTPPGEIELTDLVGNVYRGSVSGDAHIDIRGPGEAAYRFRARADDLEANDFLSNLTPARDILFGSLRMESEWEGSGLTEEELLQSLTASGNMKVKDGSVRNLQVLTRLSSFLGLNEMKDVRFREMWSSFSVAGGRLRVDDLVIASSDADWNVTGSVGFDGTLDYGISVHLSEQASRRFRERTTLANLFADGSGRIPLDFRVTGTAKNPVLTYDAAKTASRAGVRNLGDLLEKLEKDEKVKGVVDDLLGGGKNPLDGLLGRVKKKDTPPDTSAPK
ncbi:MAG: AsmA-like C-terminal region-containing protein [Candidatus Eisenbacteria bacterium]